MTRMFFRVCSWLGILSFLFALFFLLVPIASPIAYADGGAPNLAYIAGTRSGISAIDIGQQKVTTTLNVAGDPHMILLSIDGRFLYVTQPQLGRVAIIGARAGNTICTANVPGQPTLLALDPTPGSNVLFAAGNGASSVTELDPTTCAIKHTYQVNSPVQGLAVAPVGSGLANSNGSQLWVADNTSLNVFDDVSHQEIISIPIPGGPHYVSIPAGATVYTTTRQGSVDAIDLTTHRVMTVISGGSYGPMDYDATTGEVYVPDLLHNQIVVLTPVDAGSTVPHEPSRVVHLNAQPQSIAITSDGQLGFVALVNGDVAMLDIPGRQLITTIHVGGTPHFIITGLYPPLIGTTPQQASVLGPIFDVAAYAFVIALFLVPILLFRRYAKANSGGKKK